MIKIRRNNMQSFCRTCLEHLQSTSASNFKINQTPNLTKLLIVCASLNIDEDTDAVYPQSLCRKCYDTMQQFCEFREMAQQSGEVLRKIVMEEVEKNVDTTEDDTSDLVNPEPEIKMEFEVESLQENDITNKSIDPAYDFANDSDSSAPTTSTAKKRKVQDSMDVEKFLCKFYGCNAEFKTLQSLDDHIASQHATGQRTRKIRHDISYIDMDESENSNTSASISETFERQEPESTAPSSSAVPTPYASLTRLNVLDGKFFKYLPEESTDSSIVALCMKCWPLNIKLRGYNNCSSNFLSHLKRKHGQECVQEYKIHLQHKKKEKLMSDNDISNDRRKVAKFIPKQILLNPEQFNTNITKYFIHSMVPLEIVENVYFIKIFIDLENGLKVMNKKELKSAIEYYHIHQMNKIKNELQNDSILNVCTAADMWSNKSETIVIFSAHWITNVLTRKSVTLDCKRYKNILSHERILETAKAVNAYYNLNENKVVASMSNNGSNLVEMLKSLGVHLYDSDSIDNAENNTYSVELSTKCLATIPGYLNHFAYSLTLCATIDTIKVLKDEDTILSNMHKNVMHKCAKFWATACRPEAEEITQQILQCTLLYPEKYNFNSIFNSLEQIFKLKGKVLKLQQVLKMAQPLEEPEYQYIQEYLTCNTPIAKALEIIQNDEHSYYGYVLPTLMALRLKFQKIIKKNNFTYCNMLARAYEESIATRFDCYYKLITPEGENAAIAALSHPRFKNAWLTCLVSSDLERILKIFKNSISKEITENLNESINIEKKPSFKCDESWFDFGLDSDSDDSVTQTNQLQLYKANLIMSNFFAEKSQNVEILYRYPEIKALFIKHNTPLSSSRLSKNPFLLTTMHNLSSDQEICDEMFEKRAVLKCNLDL